MASFLFSNEFLGVRALIKFIKHIKNRSLNIGDTIVV